MAVDFEDVRDTLVEKVRAAIEEQFGETEVATAIAESLETPVRDAINAALEDALYEVINDALVEYEDESERDSSADDAGYEAPDSGEGPGQELRNAYTAGWDALASVVRGKQEGWQNV